LSDAPGRAGSAAAAGAPSRRAWPTAAAAEVGAGSGALPRRAAPAGCSLRARSSCFAPSGRGPRAMVTRPARASPRYAFSAPFPSPPSETFRPSRSLLAAQFSNAMFSSLVVGDTDNQLPNSQPTDPYLEVTIGSDTHQYPRDYGLTGCAAHDADMPAEGCADAAGPPKPATDGVGAARSRALAERAVLVARSVLSRPDTAPQSSPRAPQLSDPRCGRLGRPERGP